MKNPVLLVVDDDPQVLSAVRRDLRGRYRERYTIVGATSGEQALQTARDLKTRSDELALVISDQRMPGMLGIEVLAKVRDVFPEARRVLLTAYSDIDAAIRGINEAHLDHYLSKPWDPPEERLFPVIDELLDDWYAGYQPEEKGLRVVGHQWSPRSHAVKTFLAGNLIPYRWLDVTRSPDAAALIEAAGIGGDELPALFFEDGPPLRNPEPRQIAERLGRSMTANYDVYDFVIVGAGPAGLAAAVYGASEGLRTLLLEAHSPGGQAGTSSKIENYLGFPQGISGSELTRKAVMQAQRLGAEFLSPIEVTDVTVDGGYKHLALADGRRLVSRAVLAATGMAYREHPAPGIAELTGAGVYYGAAATEAIACSNRRVIICGGGNSAGQAAMYLANHASEVVIVVRRDDLRYTMSQYLIDQISSMPERIRVRTCTEIERVEGDGHLERVHLRLLGSAEPQIEDSKALFVFIGTRPRSDWLPDGVLRDAKGFVLTGRELVVADAFERTWKQERDPLPLETSVPGLFAAGDLRAGAMNRVASAVGEGSMVVRVAHDYLAASR